MKRAFWQVLVIFLFALRLSAQTALEFFTNQANALLQPAFGFGVGNIPVYSSANPSNGYTASLHYLLQSAANAYDATTPASNSPSVFRPLFSWSSNTLFIVGYTNVTTDFYTQTGLGFKALTDPTISSNDNVWGIPWVVGMKNNPPAFNEYCYCTAVLPQRQLLFVRATGSDGQPDTNRPPVYTNQFFFLSVSNVFGLEVWNYSASNFPDPVTIVTSNQVTITVTNNYDWETNYEFSCATNWTIESWPGWTGAASDASFIVPLFTNVISLPSSYWSESTEQFVSINSTNLFNDLLPSDLMQTGWPENEWMLSVTNNVMYGLIDNNTGQVLDFVNLGNFGSSIPIIQVLEEQQAGLPLPANYYALEWATNGATDAPNSPMSIGVLNQIQMGQYEDPIFGLELVGRSDIPGPTFVDPFSPFGVIMQNCSWQAVNPRVHYTVQDLSESPFFVSLEFFAVDTPSLGNQISNSVCTLGKRNKYYNPGTVENLGFGLFAGAFQVNFTGVNDLPYSIWASTNMLDWTPIGIASKLGSVPSYLESFQFNDVSTTDYSSRFYQIRLP
jgi:hypothetical protein